MLFLMHHNAIRKGLGKKLYEKNKLKNELMKIADKKFSNLQNQHGRY